MLINKQLKYTLYNVDSNNVIILILNRIHLINSRIIMLVYSNF